MRSKGMRMGMIVGRAAVMKMTLVGRMVVATMTARVKMAVGAISKGSG
jgi:hypothetical protein